MLSAICSHLGNSVAPVAQAADAPAQRVFRAGAATSNITPLLGVHLDGTIMQIGPAKGVHDELHARCLALDDGVTRLAIVVCDSTMIDRAIFDQAKQLAHTQTGLPRDRMLMSATHTHSTPRATDLGLGKLNDGYHDFLATRIADGVRRALNNLAPAKIGWGSGNKPEFLHNRRWFVQPGSVPPNPFGEKGEQVVMNPPRGALLKPAGPVDPEVFVLSVRHADGRPLALLANYGLHYIDGVLGGQISADYFGAFADRVQALLGVDRQDPPFVGIMSNGTSGDVNAVDFSQPPVRRPPYVQMRAVADSLAQEALRVSREIRHHDWVPLAMRESELQLGVRRPDQKRIEWAKGVAAKSAGKTQLTRPEVYAREALALARYPATLPVKLQAIRIGELAIGAAPCEVFAETGVAIKQQSPFEATFVIELANGANGYLPTPQQHEWGGYETWPARSACLEVQAEPKIRAELLRLINDLTRTGR